MPLKHEQEGLVERVEVGLGVDAERARHVVEAVERAVVQAHREGPREGHGLLQADFDLALAELEEERDEHGELRSSVAGLPVRTMLA